MERSARIDSSDAPMPSLVIGLFQHRAYFEAERARYAAMAAAGCVCVVGYVGDVSDMPPGVWGAELPPGHPLADEWTLIVLDGPFGTCLIAHDSLDVAHYEATLEAGRLFRASWTFHRDDALADALRLLADLGPLLSPDGAACAGAAIREIAGVPSTTSESRLGSVTESLVTSIDDSYQRSIRLRAELEETRSLSEHDALTGLHNRRYLDRFLSGPEDAAPVTVAAMLVDVDRLKAVNDAYGHDAGDAVIRAVADALRACTRPHDIVCRFGGDEFVVLLPGLTAESALAVADRVVEAVRVARLPEPWATVALSVSVGVAPASATEVPVDRLDLALYDVKRGGRGAALLVGSTDTA